MELTLNKINKINSEIQMESASYPELEEFA